MRHRQTKAPETGSPDLTQRATSRLYRPAPQRMTGAPYPVFRCGFRSHYRTIAYPGACEKFRLSAQLCTLPACGQKDARILHDKIIDDAICTSQADEVFKVWRVGRHKLRYKERALIPFSPPDRVTIVATMMQVSRARKGLPQNLPDRCPTPATPSSHFVSPVRSTSALPACEPVAFQSVCCMDRCFRTPIESF